MKQLFVVGIATILLSCSKPRDHKADHADTVLSDTSSLTKHKADNDGAYQISTYDEPGSDLERNQTGLRELADSSVFSTIHQQLMLTLDKKHQDYFNSNADLELISKASGDIFQNGKDDQCFIVYDKKRTRISILVYDDLQNKYAELYRDLKVKNGLENAHCNYGAYGTLDFQVADELLYQRDYLIKNPMELIHEQDPKCLVADISKDEYFVLESGCLAQGFSADGKTKSLCISTSSVYNNWECLTYDKSKNEFIIFYGQAFAD